MTKEKRPTDGSAPFQKIPEASDTTGLSQYFLRRGCKAGTVPHIKSGGIYYINVPELLKKLNGDSVHHGEKAGK